jgi:hypothetical protein
MAFVEVLLHDTQGVQGQEEPEEGEGRDNTGKVIWMGITLTEEEKQLVKEGKLDPNRIEEHRKLHPVRSIDANEVEKVKQEIREANVLYKQAIERNKQLYVELQENRKKKEDCRNRIMELRAKKKTLLGLEE